tara:strand:+ start:293 stop:688 length:396 start_codon:yes stop_codon:yes gene_type:complete
MVKEFIHKVKVYYEDTDSGGVVYYANYLKFFERARTEFLKSLNLSNKILLTNHGVLIVVKSCNIEYIKSAKLEDELEIISSVTSKTKTSFIMKQVVKLDKVLINQAETHLVIVNQEGKPVQIPKILNDFLD